MSKNPFSKTSSALLALICPALFILACGNDNGVPVPESVIVNNNEDDLQTRVIPTETNVETLSTETQLAGLGATLYNLLLVAEVNPPSLSGGNFGQANHIVLNGNSAAIAYNVAGETQAGAIDIFEIDGRNTKFRSNIRFAKKDVNGVFWGKTAIYAVGADSENGGGAFLTRIPTENSKMANAVTSVRLEGYAGTSVFSSGKVVYTASGDNGEVASYDPTTLNKLSGVSIFDARAVGYSRASDQVFAFSGQAGTLHTFSKEAALISSKVVGGATTAESKSTIQVGDSMSLVSQGAEGFSIVCNANAAVMGTKGPVVLAGKDAAKTVTNGASMYKNLVFTANGEAGVYVYLAVAANPLLDSSVCQPITLTQVGYLSLGENFSANAVKFANNNLVVATGTGGLKVISFTALSVLPSVLGGESNEQEQ